MDQGGRGWWEERQKRTSENKPWRLFTNRSIRSRDTESSRKKPRSGVLPPEASVATENQSRPSPAPCRRGPSSPKGMEEDPGGAIIVMKAKDQRENLSPFRGRSWWRKHKVENLSSSLLVALECHRERNHRRGDRLHQHHHPHIFYVRGPLSRIPR